MPPHLIDIFILPLKAYFFNTNIVNIFIKITKIVLTYYVIRSIIKLWKGGEDNGKTKKEAPQAKAYGAG